MEILVNGNKEQIDPAGISLLTLLSRYEVEAGATGVAVAVNYSVVPRAAWKTLELSAGDEVEIIRATAGG